MARSSKGDVRLADVPVDVGNSVSADGILVISGGGGGGGGAVTVADGADVAQGSTTDTSAATTVVGRLQKLVSLLPTSLGSKTSANSLAVVVASDQGAVATKAADGDIVAIGTTTDASTANTVIGRLKKLLSVLPAALGSAASAASLPVVIASDQGAISNRITGTYVNTVVASSATAVAILAASARKGAIISNDSTAKLYILLDATGTTEVTASVFTVVIPAGATYELPVPVFTGRIRGIWSAANGNVGIAEIS